MTLHELSHTYPDDLDILLVGPRGQQVMLMSDAGGDAPATDVTLTFDDASPSVVPDRDGFVSGSYRPHDYRALPDELPAPAPTAPYGVSMAVFNGTDPNGTWSLYVVDDTAEDTGALGEGWSLTLGTQVQATGAALGSGEYQTVPGATVEESGDSVPNGRRVVPVSATLSFDLSGAQPSLVALIANAVLEGGDPFALTVRSSFGAQLTDGTYHFRGDYLADIYPSGTQYGFDWSFSRSTNGVLVWSGNIAWWGGHLWHVVISNITIVPGASLRISRAGDATARITWPTNFADYVLETATSLPALEWSAVADTVTIAGDRFAVTVDIRAPNQFYRLRKR